MLHRLTAVFALGALVALAASPAAAGAAAKPAPTATPLKTITHIRTSPLCTGLRRVIGPAIAKVLSSDKYIANSKPLFHDFTRASASGQSVGAQDLAVSRLETLIGPLVKNTEAVDKLLNDPYAFPKVAYSDDDQKLLQMREQLRVVNNQQKKALDVISGFVDTQQLGELQAAGHEYDSALKASPSNAGQTPNQRRREQREQRSDARKRSALQEHRFTRRSESAQRVRERDRVVSARYCRQRTGRRQDGRLGGAAVRRTRSRSACSRSVALAHTVAAAAGRLDHERLPHGERSRRFCGQTRTFAVAVDERVRTGCTVAAALRAARRDGMTLGEQ
jgi:hypothetical protein